MKNTFILMLLASMAVSVNATVWRVNNLPGVNASFTTLQAAHNASYVYPGDTIYLEPSAGSYGNLTSTKRLIIIGAGYFLTENTPSQADINSSVISEITLNAGSDGSVISGCRISLIKINASNLIIERNFIKKEGNCNAIEFALNANCNNIIIRQNYIIGGGYNYSCNTASGIYCNYIAQNVDIYNNYVSGYKSIWVNSGFSGRIANNVIDGGDMTIYNTLFENNIMTTGTFTQYNSTFNNNIGSSTQFGTANGNKQNISMLTVFVGPTGYSTDAQWQLKAGSPALGAGVGGVDCGMFGGDFPYVLSGLPGIPSVYYHEQTIDNVNQQLNISIKVKSHN